ncbi:MAG TPA: GTPase ObgE, partial [Saprospiraceae bacterium]|nr:GTPase ObgE [Saprospiraceae bacterium]
YHILLKELMLYNPQLMDKDRILAVTKSDLIDEELQELIAKEIDVDIPVIFISAVANKGITKLKDMLWKTINQ